MQPFGIVVISILIYIVFSAKKEIGAYIKLFAFAICLEAFINVGYFIKIGSYEFTYSEVVLSLLAVFSAFVVMTNPINSKLAVLAYCLTSVIILSNCFLLLTPLQKLVVGYGGIWENPGEIPSFNVHTIQMTLRILMAILISIASVSLVKKKETEFLKNVFVKVGAYVLVIVAIEFISKNIFNSNLYNTIISWIFGTGDSTVTFLLERDSVISLQGLTREPSHLSFVLFSFCLVLVMSKTKTKRFNLLFFTAIAEMMLSRSLSGLLLTACALFIYCVVKNRRIMGFLIILSLSPFILSSQYFLYYLNRWSNILNLFNDYQMNASSSEQFRFYTIFETFKLLLDRPLFGVGVGTSYAFGFLPTILSNIGIVGLILWLLFMFSGIARMKFTFKSVTIVCSLLLVWIPTGGLDTMYSMSLLLVMLILRNDSYLDNKLLVVSMRSAISPSPLST